MSKIYFDCSQFVCFTKELYEVDARQLNEYFAVKGFLINIDSEIDQLKLSYFSDVFNGTVIEIIDKEFLGYFDNWKDKTSIPNTINLFIQVVEELKEKFNLSGVKIILVDYASQEKSENKVVYRRIESNDLRNELFFASNLYFELYGNIYIFFE